MSSRYYPGSSDRGHRSSRHGNSYYSNSSSGDLSGGEWGSDADERQPRAELGCEICLGTGRETYYRYRKMWVTCWRCGGDPSYRDTSSYECYSCRGRGCADCRWWGERHQTIPCTRCYGALEIEDTVPIERKRNCICRSRAY